MKSERKIDTGNIVGSPLAAIVATVLALSAAGGRVAGEEKRVFRAGAATSNITPPLGTSINGGMRDRRATYIHDELHARCLVLDDGSSRLALVVVDSCMVPREITDAAKKRIQEEAGLAPERVLVAATHAHTAPTATPVFQSDPDPEYRRFLTGRIADAVRQAIHNLAPARIGHGSGQVPEHVFNRRWRMKDGAIPPDPFGRSTDRVRMNPPAAHADLIEPAGPTDPEVAILSVQTATGRPLALLANYSLHYVGGAGGGHISADYFGIFADRIQELLGADRLDPPFVGILTNGTSGDINNIDFRKKPERRGPYEQMRRVAHDVAAEVHRALGDIEYRDRVTLGAAQAEIELGVRKPPAADLERARGLVRAAGGEPMKSREGVYGRETVFLDAYPDRVALILQTLRIGDLGIAAIPCEVFVEIGLEIKERSPLKPAFTIELANGYNGYLPTREQHRLGGYETWRARSSYLEVDAAGKIVATLLELFGKLKK